MLVVLQNHEIKRRYATVGREHDGGVDLPVFQRGIGQPRVHTLDVVPVELESVRFLPPREPVGTRIELRVGRKRKLGAAVHGLGEVAHGDDAALLRLVAVHCEAVGIVHRRHVEPDNALGRIDFLDLPVRLFRRVELVGDLVEYAKCGAGVFPIDIDLAVLEGRANGRTAHAGLAVGRETFCLEQCDGHRRHDLLLGEGLATHDNCLRRCTAAPTQHGERKPRQQRAKSSSHELFLLD